MTRILIAEDNELNLKLMTDLLSFQNFEIDSVQDGEEALSKIKEFDYDLVLLDLQMPKVSGFEVLEKLQNCSKKVKVVVVSACAMSEEMNRAKELGCLDFITKPIRISDFVSTVKKALD